MSDPKDPRDQARDSEHGGRDPEEPGASPCTPFEELLALELYDELPAEELASLHEHLVRCVRCKQAREELRAVQGVLRERAERLRAESLDDAVPASLSFKPRRRPARTAALMLASFAAGMWLMAQLRPGAEGPLSSPDAQGANVAEISTFERASPPPPATSSGALARVSILLDAR